MMKHFIRICRQTAIKFKQDMRGAVTVFVTLLLIPALLISGTGVDVARIYSAKSVLHDANQLAANAALASYDALLQDLYGLFGIMAGDQGIAQALSLDDYVKNSIFPENGKTGLGTFQLFYGSNLQPVNVRTEKNLSDTEVLRRQIEEYSKFRAPAVIASEIVDRLQTFSDVQQTSEIIHDKMEIEDELEELEKIYSNIYDDINDANGAKTEIESFQNTINTRIANIGDQFGGMSQAQALYADALANPEPDDPPLLEYAAYTSKEDVSLYLHYYRRLPYNFITKDYAEDEFGWRDPGIISSENIMVSRGFCFGGDPYENREHHPELMDRSDWFECDINTLYATRRGSERLIYCTDGERIYYTADHYAANERLELLYDGFETEENKKANDFHAMYSVFVGNIRALVNGGDVYNYTSGGKRNGRYVMGSRSLAFSIRENESALGAISEAKKIPGKYRKYLDKLVKDCKKADEKKEVIQNKISELRVKLDTANCSDEVRSGIRQKLNEYEKLTADLEILAQAMKDKDEPVLDRLDNTIDALGYGDPTRENEAPGSFYLFSTLRNASENNQFAIDQDLRNIYSARSLYYNFGDYFTFQECSTAHSDFYALLEELFKDTDKNTKKGKIKDNVAKAMGKIQEHFKEILDNVTPEGAWYYSRANDSGEEDSLDFGTDGKWNKKGEGEKSVKKSLDSSLVKKLGDGLNNVANDLLLLTYASEMFSCFSTNKRSGEAPEKSMNGIPFGVQVNYFYQSELEYLYHGNEHSALANLAAVTGMIFLVRFVMDYLMSFSIDEVNQAVDATKTALAGLGPFAVVAGELVRVAMALGEGVIDVGRLKKGDNVVLLKKNGDHTWRFSLDGFAETLTDIVFDDENGGNDDDSGIVLSYKDYLRLFLILSNKTVLAQRVGHLIELNVTNYRDKIGNNEDRTARENAMSNASLFRLEKAVTDFEITTNIQMKMLFLSMPYAQQGINGTVPPGTLDLSVTDYRGY